MVNGLSLRQVCARIGALLSLVVLSAPAPALAGSFGLFDRTFIRQTSAPETVTFTVPAPRVGTYHLRIETDGVASAIVTLNGATVVRTNDFTPNVRLIDRAITLQAQNRLTVEVRGEPGGTLRLFISGEDTDLPVIRATVDPPANAAGWHRDPVRVTFICTDATSGILTCPATVTVSTEGRGQVVNGQAVDKAGNVASASVTINLDRTPPAITPSVAPPANGEGWHNVDPTATFACIDALSGVASCSEPQTLSREGAAQPVTGQAADAAGNVATASLSISLDKTAPRITATLSAPANAGGWHNGPVTVTFTCDDAGSGIASCPSPVTVSGEGTNQPIVGVARDRAGNAANATVQVSLDTTAPVVRPVITPASVNGWHAGDVNVAFACEDTGSGVAECPAARQFSAEGADQPVNVSVTDRAGNTGTTTASISIDRTAPAIQAAISPAANEFGWHHTPATVTFTCTDALSGVAECPAPVVIDQQMAGHAVSGTVRDRAGNTAAASATVNLDLTPPTIRAIPSAGGVASGDITVQFQCEDTGSGIATCPAPIVLTEEGLNQSVEGTALDRAGNTARAVISISIDRTAPTIIATVSPAATPAGWHNGPATVTFTCADNGAGVAACPEPVVRSAEGAAQQVSGTTRDAAGNEATATVEINIDLTPPVVRAAAVTTEWTNQDVAVQFTCEDALSGIAECQDPITVGAEGEHAIAGGATDKAGNVASAAVTVKVDRTPPAITATLDRSANAAGWFNAPVTATFACEDARSGVMECPPPVVVTSEGENQAITRTVTDRAGNTASATVDVSLDTTPPVIEAALNPPGPWANTDVQVSFLCTDTTSGIATCSTPETVSNEGAGQGVEGRATDRAGNEAIVAASVSIDRIPPTIAASVSPAANAQGWHRADPTVSFACDDAASGVAECTEAQVVTEEGRNRLITGTVRDAAGNIASASLTVSLDKTPPTVNVTTPSTGAVVKTSPAAVTGGFADTLSGTTSIACNGAAAGLSGALFSCDAALAPGAQTITVVAADAAGNTGTSVVAINFDPNNAPIARPGGPYTGETGTALSFNGAASSDPEGQTLTYAWDFGDGTTAVGATPTHAYASVGTFVVRLIVSDAEGATNAATTSAVIVRANRAPTASAGGPYAADINVPVSFDGSASSDPDSDVLTYTWNFGDGGTGTGQRPRRSYLSAGTFTATLTVTDGRGGSHVSQAQVTVRTANQNPVANVGGPYSGTAKDAIAFSGARSRDPDNDSLSYAWTFGDGGTATGATPAHTYTNPGTFNVSLTVTDVRGGSHSASTQATISAANDAPTAHAGGPYSGRVGQAIAFDGSESSDPNSDALTYAWSFGDGRSVTGATPTHTYESAGSFTVTLTVEDGKGGRHEATSAVTVTERTAEDNRAPVANAGGPYSGETAIPITFSATASSDPDGDVLQYAWNFGDGSTAAGPTAQHAYLQANTYNVTLTVTDGHGGSHIATVSAVVATQADRAPPTVSLSGPGQVLPGTEANVTAVAYDNTAVTAVTFEVEGAASSTVQAPPYQRAVAIPPVASPGDRIVVKAIATDAAGNVGDASMTLTIITQPDGTAPIVALSAPPETAPGATLRVGATATDDSGVATVTFRINGTPIPAGGAPYQVSYQVPADATAGTQLPIVVEAEDFAGNRGTANGSVVVAATGDVTPPTVTVVAPATTRAGVDVQLLAQAADEGGLSAVTILVNGVPVKTLAAPPYQVTYRVPESLLVGTRLQVEARAVDFAGLQGDATASMDVVGDGAGDGVVTGEVYDDTTGLPVAGAMVSVIGPAEAGADAAAAGSIATDARGRYTLRLVPGDALVRIAKPGFTTVDRPVTVATGTATELFDARLTPLAPNATSIAPVLGGTLQANGVSLTIPAGAVTTETTIALTRVGAQGLRGLLPAGWSPVVSFDLSGGPGSAGPQFTFAIPVSVSVPRTNIAPGTPLLLATWDAARRGWRVVSQVVAGPGVEPLQASVDAAGQYAFLRADAAPAVPPAAVVGELVAGVALPQVPDDVEPLVSPQPKVIFYQPGVRSDVLGSLTLAAPLSSGTRLWSRLTESYQFYSDAQVRPEPLVQDLVFYQSVDDDRKLLASYPVTPSATFEALSLKQGVISVELIAPPEGAADVQLIDADGGQVTIATGERLDVAAGLTTAPLAARLTKLAAADVGAPVPAGFQFVGALGVSFAGASLTDSAVLSMPRPDGLADNAQILLARTETVQGETKLVLVGIGRVVGDRVVSEAILPKNKTALEGVRAGGRYVFVRPTTPVGFIAGQVIGPQGTPFTGAQVSTDTVALVSLSRAPGLYVAAGAVGAVKLTALDLQKSDTGFAQATLASAGAEVATDLRLVAQPPRVVSVSPAHGASNVAPSDPIVVVFSEPIDPASLAGHVSLAAGGTQAEVTTGLTANNTTLTLRPAQPLAADASYTLTIDAVKDLSGYELAAVVTVQFATVDTTAPLPPAAGSISATIPENGTTTVRGTQGTAGAHDTVTVENLTRGTSTPVLLDPNGGFLVLVQASQGDALKIKIVDPSGNETLVDVPRFTRTNADGSVTASVGAEGGRIEGPGGVAIDIAAGTFDASTLVTVKPVAETAFPLQLSQAQAEVLSYAGGLQVDFGGAEPQRYVDVSVPAAARDKPTDQWMVAQATVVNGVQTFNMVDMALLEAGRITTASPPCPGVTGQGVYGIYKSNRDVGLNYGEVFNNDVNGGLRLDVEPGVFSVGSIPILFPVIVMKQRMPMCMPVLSGNVSIADNQLEISIDPDHVTPADRSIVVQNTATVPAGKYSFPRNILEYAFRVPGRESDPFDVIVEKVDGSQVLLTSQQVASISKDAGANTVTIRLNMDKLNVTPKKFIIRNKSTNPPVDTEFLEQVSPIALRVAGAPGDNLLVSVVDGLGDARAIPFQVRGASYPTGNLALRAVSGTIDPPVGQAPAGQGVKELWLGDENSTRSTGAGAPPCGYAVCMPIDLSLLDNGALVFPFQGDRTHRYGLHVIYEDGDRDYISIPGYRLVVTSTQTGRVIKRITAQAPVRGAPANLGTITDDEVRPILTEGPPRYDAYDPAQPLTFAFTEAIDEVSARKLIVTDSTGRRIEIAGVILSPDGRRVTFVPKASLALGETYTLDFSDVTDVAGNKVLGEAIKLKTFEPRRLCMNDGGCQATDTGAFSATVIRGADIRAQGPGGYTLELEPISDLDFLRKEDGQGRLRTHLFMTLGGYGTDYRISAFDVTDPRAPFEEGREFGGKGKRRMTLIKGLQNFRVAPQYTPGMQNSPYSFPLDPDDDPCPVPNQLFTGDIAVLSSFMPEMSFVTFYDVTRPWQPCVLGDKLLTASPFALSDFNRKNTIHASGFARGVGAITHDDGISIFTAVGQVGVTSTDLAENIPSRYPDARLKDALYSGDVIDLKVFRDRLLIARRDTKTFEVLDVNMTPVASIDLPERPVRLVAAEAYQFDANQDGQIAQDEVKDLAFVATDTCSWNSGTGTPCESHLQVVDVTTLSAPSIIGSYTLPGPVFSIDLDAARQRIVLGGGVWDRFGGGHAVYMLDASKPDESLVVDADGDDWDDRIVWRHDYSAVRPDAVKLDTDRGLAYVGLAYYTATMKERGALDIWALFDDCCDLGVDFTAEPDEHETGADVVQRELRALRAGIKKGLDDAASCGVPAGGLAMLEQGSGACIWRGDCDGTYQPGISDHDYEVFFPQITADSAGVPAGVKCVIDALNDVFKDHKPVKYTNRFGQPAEMSFDDVTFYPVAMGELTRGRLGIHPPTAAGGSDPGGDLGMGRQQLLLKWLLEGEYVHGVPGVDLKGPHLDWVLQLLRTSSSNGAPTGVPVLEGYEWARLMEYNLAKAKTYIRIKGASETTSAFHDFYLKQLHDAGKFGLRATLARMVAEPAENERAVGEVTRALYRSGAGCVDMAPNVASGSWAGKACGSFEEYVASAASRSPLFTEAEKQLIARFYRVKSDKELIPTEQGADQFIAATHQFVQAVAAATYTAYQAALPTDPQKDLRFTNMSALVGSGVAPGGMGGKLHKELREAKLKLTPRFFNQGFRNADQVLAVMYRDVQGAGTGAQADTLRVSLAGGESKWVTATNTAGAPFVNTNTWDRNLNDLSELYRDSREHHFVLGRGTAVNPYVDQSASFNVLKNVVFTIDLPSHSGEPGHKVKEANRENNYNGFTYYILDRQAPAPPDAAAIPLPLASHTIDPDPSCFTEPQIRVLSQNISFVNNTINLNLQNVSDKPLFNVRVCSDLANTCETLGDLGAGQPDVLTISFAPPSASGTYGSNVTVYARTIDGQDIALRWNNTLTHPGSPFDVKAFDNTPLNALGHPLSRYTVNRDSTGADEPVAGVTTDGTDRALRVRIANLRPGLPALIRLLDADTMTVLPGIGQLHYGDTVGTEIPVTPDLTGAVELHYTPPAVFVRAGHENTDFHRVERAARVSVAQDGVGVTNADISLRRPPVFLVHGLFGTIDVWKDFHPLVPEIPAQYYVAREGFDGRFDLFTIGYPYSSQRFSVGAQQVKTDLAVSLMNYLPRYAVGKVDIIGHSMGGVLSRKAINETPQIAEAVRKLILINSPQGGSQVADKIVAKRDELPAKFEQKELFDFVSADPGKVLRSEPDLKAAFKVEWCSVLLNSLGRSGILNVHEGGVDDLRTTLKDAQGNYTEIGKLVFGDWLVPTHHVVDTASPATFGVNKEVIGLWAGLGLFCNLTPDSSTVELTKLVKIGAEAVKTIAPLTKAAGATRTRTGGAWSSGKAKNILMDTLEGGLKKGAEEIFGIEEPEPVFDTPNDRVVPTWSQLGDGNDESLPPGPLNLSHPAVSEVFGNTDHQAAKITPGLSRQMCITVDTNGVPKFDERIQDFNGDGEPDPTCRILGLLEADPHSAKFYKSPEGQ